jgi:hypothetical protein
MTNTKRILSILFVLIVLLVTAKVALAADPTVTATVPEYDADEGFEAIVGQNFTLKISGNDSDGGNNSNLDYTLSAASINLGFEIQTEETDNGLVATISWIPENNHQGNQILTVKIKDEDDDEADFEYDFTVLPVLDITSIRVGKVGEELRKPNEDGLTQEFRPGDNLTFEVTITNRFTENGDDDIIQRDDVDATIEEIEIVTNADNTLTEFPEDIHDFSDQQPLALAEGTEEVITFGYQIPYGIAESPDGEYDITFDITGHDSDIPENDYSDSERIELKVSKKSHAVVITKAEWLGFDEDDLPLSCADKQDDVELKITLANIGASPESVKVNVQNSILKDGSKKSDVVNIAVGQSGTVTIAIDPATLVGSETFDLSVFRTARPWKSLDQSTISLSGDSCAISINEIKPANQNTIVLRDNIDDKTLFNVKVTQIDGVNPTYHWYVTKEGEERGRSRSIKSLFSFDPSKFTVGNYRIVVLVNQGHKTNELETTWKVQIVDRPVGFNNFPGTATTDIESQDDLENVDLVLENNNGKIQFSEPVDLSNTADISQVVKIQDGLVAVDTENAPELSVPARITLKKGFKQQIIMRSVDFSGGNFEVCPENVCQAVSSNANEFVFTVTSFSSYKVLEVAPAALSVGEIFFNSAAREGTANLIVKVTNSGSVDSLTNLRAEVVGDLARDYNAVLSGQPVARVAPGQSVDLNLQISVPADENSGKHIIGDLRISTDQETKNFPVYLSTESFLEIVSIKVEGKTSGDLQLEEETSIEVKVKNNYNEDMENVRVTVKILDVDGDDLEEESDEEDIDEGKSKEFTVKFDLKGEKLDEEKYTIEVTVEGQAVDDSDHETVETKQVDVNRKNHQVIISRTSLSSTNLECLRRTSAQVTVENVGKSNEDEVEIRITNTALDLDLTKSGIEVDKFSRSDNDHKSTFSINVEDAAAGTYPLTVEVYRDGKLDDTEELLLIVKDCGLQQQSSTVQNNVQSQPADNQLAQLLQQQLQQRTQAQQQASSDSVTTSSFRQSSSYVMLLGVLIALVFIALVLALAVIVVKRR